MKKGVALATGVMVCALGLFGMFGCAGNEEATDSAASGSAPSGDISVYSREDGSGTRGAFVELTGVEQEDESGESVDLTTSSAAITNSTSVMMTSVAGDENSIGYISLGSLDDSVKAVAVDGVVPSADTVKSGEYPIFRPFNIVTQDGLSEASSDFVTYILSTDGQQIVGDEGYIPLDDTEAYQPANVSGKVVVAGSSSVTPVMEKLAEAYQAENPNVTIEINQSDSTTGVQMAIEGTCDIGMASRDLKDSESSEGVKATVIAQDGIAVIVNPASSVDKLSVDQVMRIYTGEITSWEDVLA